MYLYSYGKIRNHCSSKSRIDLVLPRLNCGCEFLNRFLTIFSRFPSKRSLSLCVKGTEGVCTTRHANANELTWSRTALSLSFFWYLLIEIASWCSLYESQDLESLWMQEWHTCRVGKPHQQGSTQVWSDKKAYEAHVCCMHVNERRVNPKHMNAHVIVSSGDLGLMLESLWMQEWHTCRVGKPHQQGSTQVWSDKKAYEAHVCDLQTVISTSVRVGTTATSKGWDARSECEDHDMLTLTLMLSTSLTCLAAHARA